MKSSFLKLSLLVIIASISSSFSAPLESKQNTGCNTSKGLVRSSVDAGPKEENVHLLADLDALANGIKKSSIESGCEGAADKKSNASPVKETAVGNVPSDKKQIVNVIKETSVVNEDDVGKQQIVETGKAAIRSAIVTNTTASENSSKNAVKAQDNATSANNQAVNATEAIGNSTAVPQGTAAKTFIASNTIDVNASKRSGSLARKGKQQGSKIAKTRTGSKKSNGVKAAHKTLHASSSIEDGPSMQTGSLAKEAGSDEKATTKSTSNTLSPLNSAIKSLDSATKLLGMASATNKDATSSNKDATTSNKATTSSNSASATSTDKTSESDSSAAKSTAEQIAELKPSAASNMTSPDVTSSTRSSGSSSADAKPASAKVVKAVDPYAEIAVGPDSPKMPDLKTGSDKAGLPVMKIDQTGAPPEQVSFDKGGATEAPKTPVGQGSASSRAGPQDVGGILDQLTDRLNKNGIAPENPLPPTEAKAITDQLSDYDHDALDQAKGWEATGLKAIEKLKSAEFVHGNMKTELTKELTDRLAGGYGNALEGAGLEGAGSEVANLDAPAQTSYTQPQEYSRQHSQSQWPEFNSVESLDSEAQREEQSYSQYPEDHGGNYGGANEAMMPSEQNSYDRQDIPSFLNTGLARDGMDSMQQGQDYYKRSIILKPYYYNSVPYGFRHPYDD